MNMITKLATKMLAVLSVVAMIASPAAAQGLSASDMAFAFGGKAAAPAAVQQTARAAAPKAAEPITIASARGMTQTEMQETEGAWLGFVVRGAVWAGSKIKPWVRVGPSYSKTSCCKTTSIRWGSNAHHRNQQFTSPTVRNLNQRLHDSRLPGSSWRVQDRGHFHLWRR